MGRVDDFLERHLWVAFLVAAVLFGMIALPLWDVVAGRPDLWPRITLGAAIGTGIVAVIAAMALFRRARRGALATLSLVVVLALVVLTGMGGSVTSRWHTLELQTPTQAELLGAAAAIILWGAVSVLVTGVRVVAGRMSGVRHRGFVEEFSAGKWYAAACDCGWRGQVVYDSSEAFTDAGDHANTVLLTIRKIAGPP